MAGEGSFDLHKLISNQGYDCIVETIFSQMDPTTLAQCRLVSKSWKALIDNRKSLLICQFKQLTQIRFDCPEAKVWYKLRRIVVSQRKLSVLELFPEFKQVLVDLERNGTQHDFKSIVVLMKDYAKHQSFPVGKLQVSLNVYKRISRSPLHLAIEDGNQEFVKVLMRRTNFDFQSPVLFNGQMVATYLGLAVRNQAIVELFLDYAIAKGLNLNISDGQGRTAFHYACIHGKLEVVKLFLEKVEEEFLGANILDREGYSPLHLACIGNKPKNVQYLLTLSMQFDINAIDRNGWTLLHLAAKHGYDKVVQVILDASLEQEININAFDFENKTPFTIACMNGHIQVAKLMIDQSRAYQIYLNLLDFQGNSAIHFAFENAHLDIIRLIIDESEDKGISLNQEDDFLRDVFLKVYNKVNSGGRLVFGRRPELWDPMMISSQLLFFSLSIFFTAIFMFTLIMLIVWWFTLFQYSNLILYVFENFIDWLKYYLSQTNQECLPYDYFRIGLILFQKILIFLGIILNDNLLPICPFVLLLLILSTFLITKSKTIWKTHYHLYRYTNYLLLRVLDL